MQKHLAISISEEKAIFTLLENSSICESQALFFKEKTDSAYKEQLDIFIKENKLKDIELDEITLTWFNNTATLIPNNVFSTTKPEDILKLCFHQKISNSNVDYNRIPELSIVNVFEIPLWVKSFFVIRFPRIIIQHEISFLVRNIFKGSTFNLNSYLHFNNKTAYCIVINKNEMIHLSSFEFSNVEDILYQFLFILQQKELIDTKNNIILSSGNFNYLDYLNEIKTKLHLIQNLKTSEINIQEDLLIKAHIQCV